MSRTKSSARWLREHFDDEFVKRAQKEGYRGRAVYKLKEIDQRDRLFRSGMTVVDLGAAPGSWSQYAVTRVGPKGRVIAIDVLAIEPIGRVEVIQGDLTEPTVLDLLTTSLKDRRADLVLSDLAPNISGIVVVDQAQFIQLAESVLQIADQALVSGGSLLLKAFQGEAQDFLNKAMRHCFNILVVRKPLASRRHSREIYLLGSGFRGQL